MTPYEKFERAKANVLDVREELCNLDKPPRGERRQQLIEMQKRHLDTYYTAAVELRATGQPLGCIDFLR